MSADLTPEAVALDREGRFHAILAELLLATGAMRTTVRLDLPLLGWSVNVPCAEVLASGARSMRGDASIDHRRARSIRWIEAHRQTLVQGDVHADPAMAPPPALVRVFGTRSQMVSPVIGADGYLAGWVSAHFAEGPRSFAEADLAAIEAARDAVAALAELPEAAAP